MSAVITAARQWAAAGMSVVMLTALAVAWPSVASAQADPPARPTVQLERDRPVPVAPVTPTPFDLVDPSADLVWDPAAVVAALPGSGRAVFTVQSGQVDAVTGAEDLPVSVRAVPRRATRGTVSVEVLGREAARTAGVPGVVVTVSGRGEGPVELVADYSGFAGLYGGGWASRLRWVELPACALSPVAGAGCLTAMPVEGERDLAAREVSGRLQLRPASDRSGSLGDGPQLVASSDAEVRVFALMAGVFSEGAGDYRATDLSPAGSWAAGGNDGSFTYGYPLRVPPAAGPVPSVGLSYSSASHDGRTSGSNNQASWVGDGWTYEPGFIERSYKPCSLDTAGGNNPGPTGDLCWDGDGASITMSLNGTNTTLVKDDTTGQWRSAADANWRIELLGSPASSSSATSERWRVTTPDGSQFFFASEVSASGSRLTVPVFGNHTGEPCRTSSFASSSCAQAYRWLLDKVIDVHGNMSRYFYVRQTGHYGAAGSPSNRTSYHRAAHLERIEYGLRSDSGVAATGRVHFDVADRCLNNCWSGSNPVAANWPDTPWDLTCAAAPCTGQSSPAFFSAVRLAQVRTQVRDGASFRDVDSWQLVHEFLDYGDDEQVVLWLKSIQHTGQAGTAPITLPKVEFVGEALPNRVDAAPGVPAIWRSRMFAIKTETGAVITVGYANVQCTPSSLPASAHTNTSRCYPVRWTPEFQSNPIQDWFHKHVVVGVVQTDTTGGQPAVITEYEYATSGGGTSVLWGYDDSEFTEDEHRTYSVWRGFPQVTTRVGDPAEGQTRTRARFYRGMHGQPLPGGGTRNVQLTDDESNTVTDHEALAGRVFESLSFNGPTVIAGTTSEYWTQQTATRERDHDGGDLHAWMSGVSVAKSRTRLVGSTWQRTETRTTVDQHGRQVSVNSLGDTGVSGDELCTRTEYADNTTAWILTAIKRVETVSVGCTLTPSRPSDVVSDVRVFFDGSNTHGATPSKGLPTRIDELDDWSGGPVYVTAARSSYDSLGRVLSATDALDRTTTTAYTPAGAGPLTETLVTNPLGHQSRVELDPAWGVPTATVEANGRRATIEYDALGRTVAAWQAGRNPQTFPAQARFEYLVRDNGPSAVTTKTLNHAQNYVISIDLYDSLLRHRQSQQETADGERVLTEMIYDTHGRVEERRGPYYNDQGPATTLMTVPQGDTPRRVEYRFDAAGRVTDEILFNRQLERWRTITTYGGSSAGFMVAVQPPAGAPATATIADARGHTIVKRTYHGNTPAGAFDALTYSYTPAGQLETMIDPAGNTWSWGYDLRGRQIASHDPDTGTTTMAYDVGGQMVETTDARGETLRYQYDDLGRMLARRDGDDTLLAEWEYDTVPGGIGQVAKSTRWHDGEPYIKRLHNVDIVGRPVVESTTLPPSLGPLAGPHFLSTFRTIDGQVDLIALTEVGGLPDGVVLNQYDHVGNNIGTRFAEGPNMKFLVDEATYTPFGEIQSRTLGRTPGDLRVAWHGFAYEEDTRRLARATFERQGTIGVVADVRYTYDDAGNVTSIADVPPELSGNQELQCFQYDGQRRLVQAWAQGDTQGCAAQPSMGVLGGPGPFWNSYSHDVTGNRTGETLRVPGQAATVRSYSYPASGQPRPHAVQQASTVAGPGPSLSYSYDQAGNTISRTVGGQVQELSWDVEGRLVEVGDGTDTSSMVYDADGVRLLRHDGEQVTVFLPHTEVVWDTVTDDVHATRYFTHAGQVVATATGTDPADWVYHAVDHHGSTATHTINAFTGVHHIRRMDPYGNPRGTAPLAWPGQQGFVGGVHDPTGLVHIGARPYDPLIGRFITVDPILDTRDGQQINGYSYAHNNPLTYSDPTGLLALIDVGAGGKRPSTASVTPDVVNAGLEDNGTIWTGYSDGSIVLNDLTVPAGAIRSVSPSEVARLVDIAMVSQGAISFDQQETFDALTVLCEQRALDCDLELLGWHHAVGWSITGEQGAEFLHVLFAGMAMQPAVGQGVLRNPVRRGHCSFSGDTHVLMADGSTMPISQIQPGDHVWATDPETGLSSPQEVLAIWVHEDTLISLSIQPEHQLAHPTDPSTTVGLTTITTTADHPFWNHTTQQWQPAQTLDPGDQLHAADSTQPTTIGLLTYTQHTADAYNLTIDNIHTYYVLAGNTPILVHNCPTEVGGSNAPKRGRAEDLQPDPNATGDHSVFERDANGRVTRYQTWIWNDRNPKGWDKGPRFRGTGGPHSGIEPPIYYPRGSGRGIPAEGEYLPRGY